MNHSPYTNLGSNQDPDDWHAQKVDRESEETNEAWPKLPELKPLEPIMSAAELAQKIK